MVRAFADILAHYGWPVEGMSDEEISYDIHLVAFGFLPLEARTVESVRTLRPIPGVDQLVVLVTVSESEMKRASLRRIAAYFNVRKYRSRHRSYQPLENIVILVRAAENFGIARFRGEKAMLCEMALLQTAAEHGVEQVARSLAWDHVCAQGISIDEGFYTASRRERSQLVCTREHVEILAPELLPLFDDAVFDEGLTHAEDLQRTLRAVDGDEEARLAIVRSCLPSCFTVALRCYQRLGCLGGCFESAVMGGVIGVMKALDGYEPSYEIRFKQYAWGWISRTIDREYCDSLFPVSAPYYKYSEVTAYIKAYRANQRSPRPVRYLPDYDPIEQVEVEELTQLLLWNQHAMWPHVPEVADEAALHSQSNFERWDELEWAFEAAQLAERDRDVLRTRYRGDKSLVGIAKDIGITRARAAQLETRGLAQLRQCFELSPHGELIQLPPKEKKRRVSVDPI